MKKLFVMAAAILFTGGISAFASGTNSETNPEKEINYQIQFNKIVVNDDIDLVVEESTNRVIDVTGTDADVENVEWKIKSGVLYLKSKNGSLKNKVRVTVSVNQLKEISITGESIVSSLGQLDSPSLHVFIDGDSYISLKNTGNIYVSNSPGTQLDIRKVIGEVVLSR